MSDFEPVHPGEILKEQFLDEMKITTFDLYKAIRTPFSEPTEIEQLANLETDITVDLGLRLSRAFGLSDMYWINLQVRYDLEYGKAYLDKIKPLKEVQEARSEQGRSLFGENSSPVCGNCQHGSRDFCHRGIDGSGRTGLCLKMWKVPEGTPGAFRHPTAGWVVRCNCTEWKDPEEQQRTCCSRSYHDGRSVCDSCGRSCT